MQFINPNQAKITTTGFAPGEARILTTEEATLLFGGGTIFRVSEPGPLKGEWCVVKVNPKSIKISSLVGPDGALLPDQEDNTRANLSYDKFFEIADLVIPAAFGSAVCSGWGAPGGSRFKLTGPTVAMPPGAVGDKRCMREAFSMTPKMTPLSPMIAPGFSSTAVIRARALPHTFSFTCDAAHIAANVGQVGWWRRAGGGRWV